MIVKGTAHEINNTYERFVAEDLPLYPWVAAQKPSYERITPNLVSVRRFHVADDARLGPTGADFKYHTGQPRLPPD